MKFSYEPLMLVYFVKVLKIYDREVLKRINVQIMQSIQFSDNILKRKSLKDLRSDQLSLITYLIKFYNINI